MPAYAGSDGPALMRMFERDKDELRVFGVPIETVAFGDPQVLGYRLRPRDFYLPFLAVATSGRAATRPMPQPGYRSLPLLAFEPDELAAVAEAAVRVRQLGDPLLAADAERAMRTLTFDLPGIDGVRGAERVVAERVDERTFALLARAVFDRKTTTFDYAAPAPGVTGRRDVEPYGLAFLGSHWYLVARDRGRGQLRTFRLGRMSGVIVNRARAQSADYEIPPSFSLEQHARTRSAWSLGDGAVLDAVVDFIGSSGAVRAAMKLGAPVSGSPGRRRFEVRRVETFARWLLAFGGNALPIEPPELLSAFDRLARATLGVYEGRP